MAEPKYPGPWEVDPNFRDGKGLTFIVDTSVPLPNTPEMETRRVICICTLDDLPTAYRMAAAQDMYAALDALRKECVAAGFGDAKDYGWPAAMANASAALAKARGETP